ncbi:MAG: hypothetical protein V3T77_10590 [Planctomycetota bacterium]
MKRRTFLVVSTAVALALVPLAKPRADEPKKAGNYVVHEWGTFTSMQGSDGVTLDGLQHEEEALPAFVYSRREVRECPLREYGYKGLEVDVKNVSKKMETPVIYFYSKDPLRVRTRVCFNRGLLTQWYPVSNLLGPVEGQRNDGPLDMRSVEKSFLEWEIDVLAKGEGEGDEPWVADDDPWAFARIPRSNMIRTVPRVKPRLGPTESERFIFYRGLGQFDLPVTAKTAPGGEITIENGTAQELRHLFVLHVHDHHGAFSYVPSIAAGASQTLKCPASKDDPDIAIMVRALRRELAAKLVIEGLTPDEAEAMTRTWERSYFHTEGLRVLYVVPRAIVDRILPIAFDPPPEKLVRVMVGRLECITPEVEAEIITALSRWRAKESTLRKGATARLDRLGRFLEPHLRRVLTLTEDAEVIANARQILRAQEH